MTHAGPDGSPGPPATAGPGASACCSPPSGWSSWSTRSGPRGGSPGARTRAAGWVGLVATVGVRGVLHRGVHLDPRRRRRRLQMRVRAGGPRAIDPRRAAGADAVMCVCVGEDGSGRPGVRRRGRRAVPADAVGALALTVVLAVDRRGARAHAAGLVEPGRASRSPICTAAFAMWGVSQLMARNVDLLAGPGGERPARGRRRAQPVRPRPARHPRATR